MLKKALKVFFGLLFLKFKARNKNQVLLVAEYGKTGGTRTYFIYLLHFLHTQGYNVSVLPIAEKNEDEEIEQLLEKYNYNLLPTSFDFWCTDMNEIPAGLSKSQLIYYQLKELEFWLFLQKQYRFSSVILSVAYPEKFLYIFLLPIQITYILHSAPVKQADKYKQFLLKFCLSSKKRILTVSFFAKQSIEQYWLKRKENKAVNFIYNYYSPKSVETIKIVNQKVKKVLTIGSVEIYKNPLLFVETAKAIISSNKGEQIEFVWAGDGRMINTCKEATSNYPQIQFLGNVKNVEQLYMEASLYYQPSVLESHGIATLGAMYHGLPCVVSEHGGLKESVINGRNGFVISVDNIKESVEKINTLLHNETLCNEMGECGRQMFERKFSKDIWCKRMKLLFS